MRKFTTFGFLLFCFLIFYPTISCSKVKDKKEIINNEETVNNRINNSIHRLRIYSNPQSQLSLAILSCSKVKLEGNFLVDGYNSFCGDYPNIWVTSNIGYVEKIDISKNVKIRGEKLQIPSCEIAENEFENLFNSVKESNSNILIPLGFLKDGDLKIENNKVLSLGKGIYYFKKLKISGNAELKAEGEVIIFAEDGLKIEGSGKLSAKPYDVKILSLGDVKVEGRGILNGFVVAPFSKVKVSGNGQIFGAVIADEFKGDGNGALHFDKSLSLAEVKVFPSSATIKVEEQIQLYAKAFDQSGNELECVSFYWESEDESLAKVNQNGIVTAHAGGG